MKKQIAVFVLAISSMTIACNEKKEYGSVTDDGTMEVDESTSIDEKMKAGTDTSMSLTDGTNIPVIIHSKDSINLPQELIDVLEKTDDINPDSIVVKRRFTENNITYYELEFKMENGSNETFTFDGEGKRKSKD